MVTGVSMTISGVGSERGAFELSDPDGSRISETAQGNGPVDGAVRHGRARGVQLQLESYQVHSVGIDCRARGEASLSVRCDGEEYEKVRAPAETYRSQRAGVAGRGQPTSPAPRRSRKRRTA